MMHRTHSPHRHLNHFTPFIPAGTLPTLPDRGLPRMPVRVQRRIEFILLAVVITSLGVFVAWML